MVKKIGVSRHGLTRCPSCGQHIKVAARLAATVCPFCNASLSGPSGASSRSLLGTRGGLLAAALLAPGLVGCESDSATGASPDATSQVDAKSDATGSADVVDLDTAPVDDIPAVDVYGLPPDVVMVEDTVPQPEYGLPADVEEPSDVPVQPLYGLPPTDVVVPEDVPVQPLYGLPPTDIVESDDTQPAPMYGLPPSEDVVTEPDADSNPVPLYGLPPSTPP